MQRGPESKNRTGKITGSSDGLVCVLEQPIKYFSIIRIFLDTTEITALITTTTVTNFAFVFLLCIILDFRFCINFEKMNVFD